MRTLFLALIVIFVSAALALIFYYVGTSTDTLIVTTTSTTSTTTSIEPLPVSFADASSANASEEAIAWLEQRTFELVNEQRNMYGLNELLWNEEVAEIARAHSRDMAENDYFSHTGLDGSNASTRLYRGGVYYWM